MPNVLVLLLLALAGATAAAQDSVPPRVPRAAAKPAPPAAGGSTARPPKQTTAADRPRSAAKRAAAKRTTANAAPKATTTRAAAIRATRPTTPPPEWPVRAPAPLPGSILPAKRIVAYYGNPLSKRMGILGEVPPDEMLARLDKEVAAWSKADPATPVQPALHLIAVVAQGSPGRDGKYRLRMSDSLIEKVYSWAARRKAIVFLDLQVAKSTLQEELPRLTKFLQRPDVHLAIDPEFSMKGGHKPGTKIGSYDAADVNYATSYLADLVTQHNLPPKVLVVHRFTRPMLTRAKQIRLDPRVQIVIHMDGWGPPWMKEDSYRDYVYAEPVQFTGFKLFYRNDTKRGNPLMTPADILKLTPAPMYIQYQ